MAEPELQAVEQQEQIDREQEQYSDELTHGIARLAHHVYTEEVADGAHQFYENRNATADVVAAASVAPRINRNGQPAATFYADDVIEPYSTDTPADAETARRRRRPLDSPGWVDAADNQYAPLAVAAAAVDELDGDLPQQYRDELELLLDAEPDSIDADYADAVFETVESAYDELGQNLPDAYSERAIYTVTA